MRTLLILPMIVLPSSTAFGQLFGGARAFAVGARPLDVAIGDLDGDSVPDMVTADRTAGTVSILLGDGAGGFTLTTSPTTGVLPSRVSLADLNEDRFLDIVTANGTGTLSILLGDGMGGFGPASSIPAGVDASSVSVGDVNHDRIPDLVSTDVVFGAGSIHVHLGDGTGAFAPARTFPAGPHPRDCALGDMNRDGHLDVVLIGEVSILLGDGAGNFSARMTHLTPSNPRDLSLGDMNHDGALDVVVGHYGPSVSVFLGDGVGGLAPPSTHVAGIAPISVDVADVDADGHPDIVTANQLSYDVSVLHGDGSGGFTRSGPYATGTTLSFKSARIADVDLDGRPDIAVTLEAPATDFVAVLYNLLDQGVGSQPYGTGTAGCSGKLVLGAGSDAVVGNALFALTCTNSPPASHGSLLLSPVQDRPGSNLFDLGVLFHVGVHPFLPSSFPSDAGGSAYSALPIPNDSRLRGLVTFAQGFWFASVPDGDTCTPSIFGLVSSVGLEVVFG